MSFFSRSAPTPAPSVQVLEDPQAANALKLAQFEVEGMADLFSRVRNVCATKCVTKFNDESLANGELSCLDRCVYKYSEAQGLVAKVMERKMKEQMQMQMQGGGPMQ